MIKSVPFKIYLIPVFPHFPYTFSLTTIRFLVSTTTHFSIIHFTTSHGVCWLWRRLMLLHCRIRKMLLVFCIALVSPVLLSPLSMDVHKCMLRFRSPTCIYHPDMIVDCYGVLWGVNDFQRIDRWKELGFGMFSLDLHYYLPFHSWIPSISGSLHESNYVIALGIRMIL